MASRRLCYLLLHLDYGENETSVMSLLATLSLAGYYGLDVSDSKSSPGYLCTYAANGETEYPTLGLVIGVFQFFNSEDYVLLATTS